MHYQIQSSDDMVVQFYVFSCLNNIYIHIITQNLKIEFELITLSTVIPYQEI